eukprot:TRINITY_DN58322_c0_g1_i1.p1 TRINITY_DN58322_c0_g1~~TRINITY_DN58322_c0_g1_i1.p1  ORF type:complete len:358 (+),score=57.54 TRINITY_DN58322_c0_g1_i1:338-1411(+)
MVRRQLPVYTKAGLVRDTFLSPPTTYWAEHGCVESPTHPHGQSGTFRWSIPLSGLTGGRATATLVGGTLRMVLQGPFSRETGALDYEDDMTAVESTSGIPVSGHIEFDVTLAYSATEVTCDVKAVVLRAAGSGNISILAVVKGEAVIESTAQAEVADIEASIPAFTFTCSADEVANGGKPCAAKAVEYGSGSNVGGTFGARFTLQKDETAFENASQVIISSDDVFSTAPGETTVFGDAAQAVADLGGTSPRNILNDVLSQLRTGADLVNQSIATVAEFSALTSIRPPVPDVLRQWNRFLQRMTMVGIFVAPMHGLELGPELVNFKSPPSHCRTHHVTSHSLPLIITVSCRVQTIHRQ